MQSRKLSLLEAVVNVAVGFVISLISQVFIFSAYGVQLPLISNIAITCWFTLISIVRSYCLRRAFNGVREHSAGESTQRPPKPMPAAPASGLAPCPPPPPPRFETAYGRTLSDAETRRLRAAADLRGPSL